MNNEAQAVTLHLSFYGSNGTTLHFHDVKRALIKQLSIEEYRATTELKEKAFLEVWDPVYEVLYNKYSD